MEWKSPEGRKRNFEIWTARQRGEKYREIAARHALSLDRCRVIVQKIDRINKRRRANDLLPFSENG
jgi:Mor family transcriptional regulator